MLDLLERQKTLTSNQWRIIATANLGDMLDFFDFFLIGYVLAFIIGGWHLTFGQSAMILLSSGLGAVPGAFFWGWMADRIGRRKVFMATAINVALATGIMAFTPGENGWISGWIFLAFFRFFVGFGNAGLIAVDIPLVQEFVPSYKRGWVSGMTTVLLPAGNLMGALSGAFLAPVIGWRGLFLVGLLPAALVLLIRYWVPESPRWLLRMGRHEEARRSIAWALQVDPSLIELPQSALEPDKTRWRELFQYPRSIAAACCTALSQTGGVGLLLWITTLFVLVLKITPAEASYLMIYVSLVGIAGRLFCSYLSDAIGRRASGALIGFAGALTMAAGGLFFRCLHRHGVGVLPADHGAAILRRRKLRDHRAVYRRGLAAAAARERHGSGLWCRQSRQDPGSAGVGDHHRLVQLRQPEGVARGDLPGVAVSGVLVRVRRGRVLADRHRDQRPLDRGDRQRARRGGGRRAARRVTGPYPGGLS